MSNAGMVCDLCEHQIDGTENILSIVYAQQCCLFYCNCVLCLWMRSHINLQCLPVLMATLFKSKQYVAALLRSGCPCCVCMYMCTCVYMCMYLCVWCWSLRGTACCIHFAQVLSHAQPTFKHFARMLNHIDISPCYAVASSLSLITTTYTVLPV